MIKYNYIKLYNCNFGKVVTTKSWKRENKYNSGKFRKDILINVRDAKRLLIYTRTVYMVSLFQTLINYISVF